MKIILIKNRKHLYLFSFLFILFFLDYNVNRLWNKIRVKYFYIKRRPVYGKKRYRRKIYLGSF